MGKIFNKGFDKDDQKEGLFKRLKYIENATKKITKQQYRVKTTKCLRLFKKFKSRGQRFDG